MQMQITTLIECIKAIRQENISILKKYVQEGNFNVNDQDYFCHTILMQASWYGHKEIVEILLDAGADVNIQDNNGNTALIFALKYGYK